MCVWWQECMWQSGKRLHRKLCLHTDKIEKTERAQVGDGETVETLFHVNINKITRIYEKCSTETTRNHQQQQNPIITSQCGAWLFRSIFSFHESHTFRPFLSMQNGKYYDITNSYRNKRQQKSHPVTKSNQASKGQDEHIKKRKHLIMGLFMQRGSIEAIGIFIYFRKIVG